MPKRSSRPYLPLSSLLILICALLALAAPAAADEPRHSFGVGAHYWTAVDDLVSDDFAIDEDGLAGVLSYQFRPGGLIAFELDVEIFPDGFGGADSTAFAPAAFVLVGHGLYGGVGVGVTVSDDFEDNVSDPFYAARVGFVLQLLPRLRIDINANYRADAFKDLGDVDSDAITLGAILRF